MDLTGPVGARPAVDRPVAAVVGLGAALAIGAVALVAAGGPGPAAGTGVPWWALALLVVVFGLSERFAFHVEYRREALSFTLSEVPTAFALAFVGAPAAIGSRLLGSVIIIVAVWRSPLYKIWFNASLFAFETAFAYAIVRRATSLAGDGPEVLLLASVAAVSIATLLGSVIVSVAIACFEGDLAVRARSELQLAVVTVPVSAAAAGLALAPALIHPWLTLLSVFPVVVIGLGIRRHGHLVQRHRDLEALHGFTAAVTHSLRVEDIVDAGLAEAVHLMRAERGHLVVCGGVGRPATSRAHGTLIPLPEGAMAGEGSSARSAADPASDPASAATIIEEIRDDQGLIGFLALADRSGASRAFEPADVTRTRTLVEQLALALRRALLYADIEHAALHDALTGLPNRVLFERSVTAAIVDGGHGGVLMLDLDRFKEVNDTLGHQVGDRLLVLYAQRIRGVLRPGDLLARLAGDEFAVLIAGADTAALAGTAQRLLDASRAPFNLDDLDLVVTASVGIAAFDGVDDAAEVLRRADVAMYTAKQTHAGSETYCATDDARTPARLSLLTDLRSALANGELAVHYQPKVDLATATIVGAEALARWHHAVRGWVSPAEFVPLAEETGLIRQLTDQVLAQALRDVGDWHRRGHRLSVSVNLSTHDLLDQSLAARVAQRLREADLTPDVLTLEITESALLTDAPRTLQTVQQLHDMGIRLSIDDFGTGYSSLSYLRKLPVSEVKVDQSFVANVLLDDQDLVIVRSTIDLGHNLGLQVVAEGIETQAVLDHLRTLGCDIGQGYGISRPLDAARFASWLATTEFRSPARHWTTAG